MPFLRPLFLLLMLLGSMASLQSQKLVAYYPFNNSLSDFSGNHNDGFMKGGFKPAPDRFGNACGAVFFNGKDAYIEVPSSASLKSPKTKLTVTCWFKLDSMADPKNYKWLTLVCKGTNTEETYNIPQYRVQLFQSNVQGTVSLNTDFTEYDTNFVQNCIPYGVWNFVALVYDGSTVSTYFNNKKTWEHKYSKQLFANDEPLHIGRDIPGNNEYFKGAMDELRIFNDALTPDELNTLFLDKNNGPTIDSLLLECPADVNVPTDPGECYAIVHYNKMPIDPGCGGITIKKTGGLPSGSRFPVGTSVIQFEIRNKNGEVKKCEMRINVSDKEAPSFKCKKDTTIVVTDASTKGVKYNYILPAATDNCSGVRAKQLEGLSSGSVFPAGDTHMKWSFSDEAGNTAECSYTITVIDSGKPAEVVSTSKADCPKDINKGNDAGQCGAVVSYTVPGDASYRVIEGFRSGSLFPVGSTYNKIQFRNGNDEVQTCDFTVHITDKEAPVIHCYKDTIIYSEKDALDAVFVYETPEVTDNCEVDSVQRIGGLGSGENFPLGNTNITFRAVDVNGNSSTCGFRVTVLDTSYIHARSKEKAVKKPYMADKVVFKKDLKFDGCVLSLKLFDDNEEDNDTVSIYFNGEEIVKREMIKLKSHGAIIRTVNLVPGQSNEFVVKAWNTGRISPNTIKVEFYEGVYSTNPLHLRRQKPVKVMVLNSKPGVAAGLYFWCRSITK